jgi:hypothetical protein
MQIDVSDMKTVLMPRQHLLKRINPSGSLNVPELLEIFRPLALQYENHLIIKDVIPPGMGINEALKINGSLHQLCHMPERQEIEIPVACTCLAIACAIAPENFISRPF